MDPTRDQRVGFLGGLLGVIGGGTAWLVIAGLVIDAPLVSGLAVASGVALWLAARHAFTLRPQRWATILGVVMLTVLLANVLLLDPVWDRLPARLLGVPTGRSLVPLLQVRLTLALLAVLALILITRDFQKES